MSLFRNQRFFALGVSAVVCAGIVTHAAWGESTAETVKLAGLYLKLGQTEQCRTAVNQLLKANPASEEGLVLLGKLELKQGNQAAALKAANAVLAQAPDNVSATIVKARVLSNQGNVAEAKKLLAHVPADELEKHDEELDGELAAKPEAGKTKENSSSSEDELDKKLDAARNAIAAKNLSAANTTTLAALKAAPQNTDAIALRAEYLSQSGKPEEGAAMLQKLKARQKSNFAGELSLGYALQDAGKLDEARTSFQLVANSSSYSAEDRSQAKSALNALDQQKNLADGEAAMDAGDTAKAEAIALAALKADPSNADAKLLQARVRIATGHAREALVTLSELKASTPAGQRFEAQADYANALAADHQCKEAIAACQEIIDQGNVYTADEQTNARDQIADLRENNLAGGQLEVTAGKFEEGRLWRFNNQLSTARFGNTRYTLNTDWEHVKLDSHLFPKIMEEDRFSSSVVLNTQWDPELSTDFHLGGYESGVMAGAGISHSGASGVILSLYGDYNDPARDTLLLTAMDGRQHSLTANITVPLGKKVAFESMLIGRQIEVDGTNIGHSIGTETQVRWHPLASHDSLYLAYMLELKDFSGKDDAFGSEARNFFGNGASFIPEVNDAVPNHINRHALQAHSKLPLTSALSFETTGEVAWRQETEKVEYGAVGELLWQISSRASINARVEYYSGGSGPNAGEGVMLGTLGTKWSW